MEEGDEEAEEVVDGAQPGVAHVVRSWVWGALGREEEAATGLVDVAEEKVMRPVREGDEHENGQGLWGWTKRC